MSNLKDPKQCPWCERWCLKDNACNYIFACGLTDRNQFVVGAGCGKPWCFACGKKFCTPHYNPETGVQIPNSRTSHDGQCCRNEPGFKEDEYCGGGHDSHCGKRW